MNISKGHKGKRVAVGLSGGVDSSVSAALLKEAGYDVIGISMEIFDGSFSGGKSEKHACYGPGEKQDLKIAASVCKKLNIPFYKFDLREEYRRQVIDYFRSEYLAGRTPNPCIMCNQKVKFGYLLEKAKASGIQFDIFATGHYARLEESRGSFFLKKAEDQSKDQTYFLYRLKPDLFSSILFPIGRYSKKIVREIARTMGLSTADRPESQDFIDHKDYSSLFARNDAREGNIVDIQGAVIGRHHGIFHYTVGQRKGLGISSNRPLYVLKIDAEKNRIVVGEKEELYSTGLVATELNLLTMKTLDRPCKVKAKIRLNHEGANAKIFPEKSNRALVLFEEPQLSVTPGQSVVFYSEDLVLGGGIIDRPL